MEVMAPGPPDPTEYPVTSDLCGPVEISGPSFQRRTGLLWSAELTISGGGRVHTACAHVAGRDLSRPLTPFHRAGVEPAKARQPPRGTQQPHLGVSGWPGARLLLKWGDPPENQQRPCSTCNFSRALIPHVGEAGGELSHCKFQQLQEPCPPGGPERLRASPKGPHPAIKGDALSPRQAPASCSMYPAFWTSTKDHL